MGTQMLGTQDLAQYAKTKFSSEKQISDEFAKNKAKAMENGCWDAECNVALKAEVAKLSRADVKTLESVELAHWKKVIYNNPSYIYRTNSTKSARGSKSTSKANSKKSSKTTSPKAKGSKKKKATNAKTEQKNPLENYTKTKQKKEETETEPAKPKVQEMAAEYNEEEEAEEVAMGKPKPKKKSKAKSTKKVTKKSAKKKKGVPALPESSDDEDMLCVE